MFLHRLAVVLSLTALMLAASTRSVEAQIVVNGVADRTSYTGSAQFRVVPVVGFIDEVTLNGVEIDTGIQYTVSRMDYYDLAVRRTSTADSSVTTALVRFIVISSNRGSPERGLIEWVPLPPIPSAAAEFSGAQLHLMTPQSFPAGLDIPVVARVEDAAGYTRRANGWVSAPGFEGSAFRLVRGVGFGFLPPAATGAGTLAYDGAVQTIADNRSITIEPSTAWTDVAGILPDTTWPENARIHVTGHLTIPAGTTLTIGAGTVVRLEAGVNLTNSGRTVINGTVTQPVVFTANNRVAPEQRTGAWGGWLLRGASAELIANSAIMTGSGAAGSFSFSPGSSHRSEQPLLLMHSGASVRMTNCALINNAGQIGNGYFSSIVWDHCLLQRAITTGEYEGCTNIITRSAVIEFPSIDGVYNAQIADADYDGIYMIGGTNYFEHSLFGFAKDDAIDSGSGGAGSVLVTNCWVESALHEALAWSGEGRRTWTFDTVLINSGQGIECGWSTGNNSPLVNAGRLLSLGNSVGARYGDNYEGTSGLGLKTGFLTVTNSLILHNYRDVWGQVWDNTWNYRVNAMDLHDNYLTAPNTNHPNNTVWNPAAHAEALAPFMSAPSASAVGVGFANWDAVTVPDLTNGVPLRLSTFTKNFVSVKYTVQTPRATLASGTLTFAPGETVKRLFAPIAGVSAQDLVRVALSNPVGCELTAGSQLLIVPASTTPNTNVTLLPFGSAWKYLDDGSNQGAAWRASDFNDTGWSNGIAQLGYGDAPGNEATLIRRTNSAGAVIITYYFRKAVQVASPTSFASVRLRLLRDDAGVVYVNGSEVFRSPNLPAFPASIGYQTTATSTGEDTIDTQTLASASFLPGNNVIAVEIHQESTTSSDVSFDLELVGNLSSGPPRLNASRFGADLVLYWGDASYRLEASENLGPSADWRLVNNGSGPASVLPSDAHKFYRLRKP